jgi:hypothetical protein
MKFALSDLERLSDMVANFKRQPTVLKCDGGWPGTGKWKLHDRERDGNNSPRTTGW